MKRALAAFLAVALGVNGLAMLVVSQRWYLTVPGVVATGPFNPHFVKDVGAAYLMVAFDLAWFAALPRQGWPALVCAASFLVLHGMIHVVDAVQSPGGGYDLLRDLPDVFLPALIAAGLGALSIPRQGEFDAERDPSPHHL